MKVLTIIIIALFTTQLTINSYAQQTYVPMDKDVLAQDKKVIKKTLKGVYPGNSINYAVSTFLNVYDDQKRTTQARESAQGKTAVLKSNYSSFESYPDSIVSGWHDAVATDHQSFCKDVKVLVRKNKIKQFVIDDCIRLICSSSNPIKKGKGMVTIANFNGEESELVTVYFMNDLEEPSVTEEPMQPGSVCFWSSKNKYLEYMIIVEGTSFYGITELHDSEPKCFEDGTMSMILKPGNYNFMAKKRGNDIKGTFRIKSGQCLKYRLE
jgi:hypothetical protein